MLLSGWSPTHARSTFSSMARCLPRALMTGVPSGTTGACIVAEMFQKCSITQHCASVCMCLRSCIHLQALLKAGTSWPELGEQAAGGNRISTFTDPAAGTQQRRGLGACKAQQDTKNSCTIKQKPCFGKQNNQESKQNCKHSFPVRQCSPTRGIAYKIRARLISCWSTGPQGKRGD